MNGFRIHLGSAWLALGCLVQLSIAQSSPAYQTLDDRRPAPRKLQAEPVELSRLPRTFGMALSADGRQLRSVDVNGRVWQRPVGRRSPHAKTDAADAPGADSDTKEPRLVAETNCEPACAVLSPDARSLAYATADGNVAVLNLDADRLRFRDEATRERTVTLAFSPDGRSLAGVTARGAVRVWNSDTGKRILEFAAAASPVQTVAFSPDGQQLAIASHGTNVRLYRVDRQHDVPTTSESTAKTIRAGNARVTALAYAPDGKRLVIATAAGTVHVHDLVADRAPTQLGTHPFAIWSIVFSRDGRRMAAGSWDGTIKIWNSASWDFLQSVKKHEESVAALVFDDESGLYSAGLDGRLLAWQLEVFSVSPVGMIAGRDDSAWVAVYPPDGRRLFVGGRNNRFELWDVESKRLLVTRAGHPTTRCAAFSPDGATLATGGDDGRIFLCDAVSGQTRTTLLRHPGALSAVLFADAGQTLVSACDGGLVKVWDAATGQEQGSWQEHRQQIYCASISPDEKWLVTGGGNWTTGDPGELIVWERQTGRVRARLAGHRLAVWSIVFMPDGERFFSSDSAGAVKVWNVETLAEERTLQHASWIRPLALSPDGGTLAVGRGDGSVRLWDTSTWTEKGSCEGHTSFTFWLQYAPDGKTLAGCGSDGTVRFWEPERVVAEHGADGIAR
ncbi:MAG TPA: WD40 repeat domain-containing protein [Pirellulales bacterium]|nr:WD40 repeat domain-containing protein [Pirellulales bacterium]